MRSAKSLLDSSKNWRRPSVCWRATTKARRRERRPRPKLRPRQPSRPPQRDQAGARARRPQKRLAASAVRPNSGDHVLSLATGKTQPEITALCKGARPNHVGAAIARHKRAGRVEERDGKLYAMQSA